MMFIIINLKNKNAPNSVSLVFDTRKYFDDNETYSFEDLNENYLFQHASPSDLTKTKNTL